MKCIVTGASSGIGRDIARYLGKLGHEVILVSRNRFVLNQLSKEINNSKIYVVDLMKK